MSLRIRIERELGQRSFYEFFKLAWPHVDTSPYVDNWHIPIICGDLERVTRGEILKYLVNVSPGSSKSRIVSAIWPVWSWVQDPELRFIGASFDPKLTTRDSKAAIDLIHTPWFQERWGNIVQVPKQASVVRHFNNRGGWRNATSIGGGITGNHADIAIIDDPTKPLEVALRGRVAFERAKKWRYGTLPSRFRDMRRARIVLIMQRLGDEDLAGLALREGGWFTRIFPMKFDPKRADPKDPRKTEGELFWPARYPQSVVDEIWDPIRGLGARQASAQYQQQPAPDDGDVFKRGWFQHYLEKPARFDLIWQSWDCTFKNKEDSDFVVGQVWGVRKAEFFLLDQVRARMSFTETCAAIKALSRKWPRAMTKLIEDKANGTAVMDALKKTVTGIIAVEPLGGKYPRASAISPLYEAKNVFHPDPTIASWVDELEAELLAFPNGSNDDQVDSASQALAWGRSKVRSYDEARKKAPWLFGASR